VPYNPYSPLSQLSSQSYLSYSGSYPQGLTNDQYSLFAGFYQQQQRAMAQRLNNPQAMPTNSLFAEPMNYTLNMSAFNPPQPPMGLGMTSPKSDFTLFPPNMGSSILSPGGTLPLPFSTDNDAIPHSFSSPHIHPPDPSMQPSFPSSYSHQHLNLKESSKTVAKPESSTTPVMSPKDFVSASETDVSSTASSYVRSPRDDTSGRGGRGGRGGISTSRGRANGREGYRGGGRGNKGGRDPSPYTWQQHQQFINKF
jgi:hypothetical protein